MKVTRCCFCFPLSLGVKILGALDILSLLNSVVRVDLLMLVLMVAPVLTFVLMLVEDSKRNRMLFFIAFAFYRFVLLTLFSYKVYLDFADEPILDEQHAVANRCNMYKEAEGGLTAAGFTDFNDCYEKTLVLMTRINLAVLLCTNLLFLHFVLVVFQHWKNADLPESMGGVRKLERNPNYNAG